MGKRTHYLRPLDVDARLRVEFEVEKGKVRQFLVQLEVKDQGEWRPVIRYDCAHGYAHCDRFTRKGERHKERLPLSYEEALTHAQQDLRRNWERYRERFRKGERP